MGRFAYPPVIVVWESRLAGVEPLDWCLPTEEVGQADGGTIGMVVPWGAAGFKRVGVESRRCEYTQQQSRWSGSGHRLLD